MALGQTASMLGHLGINVADLAVTRRYWDGIVDVLGFEPFLAAEDQFAYRPRDGRRGTYLFFYPAPAGGGGPAPGLDGSGPGLQHLAFMVPTRRAVHAALDRAVELGSPVLEQPRTFPEYPQPYYAAFWRDPSGLMLEAVCHHDRP